MALDVCQKCFVLRFLALFSMFLPIFFKLCIGIGIGKEWYGIASGIISFRNNRVMALEYVFTDFLQTLHRHWYWTGVVWDCKWDNFIQKQQSYCP